MRTIGVVLGVVLALVISTATACAFPVVHLAARLGKQHTNVVKGDGAPAGWGARWELSASVAPVEWVSISGVAASSSYSDSQLQCEVRRLSYSIHVTDSWLGARLLFHPHPLLFFGVGYMSIHTTEDTDLPGGGGAFDNNTWEVVIGANVIQTRYVTVQTLFTYGNYDRFSDLEQVHFYSFGAGLQF
jgi:hypothetical protein